MSLAENRAMPARRRSRGVRLIIVTAAILFAVLALSKVLAAVYALASFAIVAAAALLALRAGGGDDRLAPPARAAARGEEQRLAYAQRGPLDRWFEAIVMPVKREPGLDRPDLVLLTFHDLTPLRRVGEMRADFVANASP